MATSFLRNISAETHPPGYLLHKYWSRKPHNVLAALLREQTNRGLFLDPFCGSGVPLSEASALGFECAGADVNPIAQLLTRVTLAPPDSGDLSTLVEKVLDEAEKRFGALYRVHSDSAPLRFAVHAIVVKCPGCHAEVVATRAVRQGRRYECPDCASRLQFNLERLRSTRIIKVVASTSRVDASTCAEQETLACSGEFESEGEFDFPFPANRRTLAFMGLTTRRLFTRRNFSCLAFIASQFHAVADDLLRSAALLLLTSAVAQCSRLIASREGLTTGGPAWTVPGFWVPPVHIETNPLVHVRARLAKFERGLAHLRSIPGRQCEAWNPDTAAKELLDRMHRTGRRARIVFLDPPYGDSVPYVEFSALWNSFLRLCPDPNLDIAVSDRGQKQESWKQYESALRSLVEDSVRILHRNGALIVTFNNKNARAWKALLVATQAAGFRATQVAYVHPAVVSAKAQMAPYGSYVGDFYCVMRAGGASPLRTLAPVADALRHVARVHEGRATEGVLSRMAIAAFLRANVSAELVDAIGPVIREMFHETDGTELVWTGPTLVPDESFGDAARRVAGTMLSAGPAPFSRAYQRICAELSDLGVPPPAVVRRLLAQQFYFRADGLLEHRCEQRRVSQLALTIDP